MTKVVFVGDTPSKKNIDPDIAFVGTACFKTLTWFIKYIAADYYICLNSDTIEELTKIRKLYDNGFKIIALGVSASKRLDPLAIEHTTLPHPSGRNRRLNNKFHLIEKLERAHQYVHQ
jgi:hypothetical protein